MVRKNFVMLVLVLSLFPLRSAADELSPLAKATEDFAMNYAKSPEIAKIAFATGLCLGFQGGFELSGNTEIRLPKASSVKVWLDYCYVQGHCRHVSPQAIAIASFGKTEHAIESLDLAEKHNTRPAK